MSNKLKIKKAFGLVEALIALVIIAITMISALKTVSSSLRQVKNNEIEDKANEFMSSALEYAYGYRNIDLPQNGSDSFPIQSFIDLPDQFLCFRAVLDIDSNVSSLEKISEGSNCTKLSSADEAYQISYQSNFEETEVIYHQVIFSNTPVSESGKLVDKIRITSIVLYEYEGKIMRQRLDAYRPLYF